MRDQFSTAGTLNLKASMALTLRATNVDNILIRVCRD